MDHQLDVIDRTVAKTYEWLHQVAERDEFDDMNRSYHVLRAVLHTLRPTVSDGDQPRPTARRRVPSWESLQPTATNSDQPAGPGS